jgi:hypothetical protein
MTDSFQTIVNDPDLTTVMLARAWEYYKSLSLEELRDGLERSVTLSKAAGKRVIIVGDAPSLGLDPTHLASAEAMPVRGFLASMLWLDEEHLFPVAAFRR